MDTSPEPIQFAVEEVSPHQEDRMQQNPVLLLNCINLFLPFVKIMKFYLKAKFYCIIFNL